MPPDFEETIPADHHSPWWFVLRIMIGGVVVWFVFFFPPLIVSLAYNGSPTVGQLIILTIGWLVLFLCGSVLLAYMSWSGLSSERTRTITISSGQCVITYDTGFSRQIVLDDCTYRIGWSGQDSWLIFVRPTRAVILIDALNNRIACGLSREKRAHIAALVKRENIKKAKWWQRWRRQEHK